MKLLATLLVLSFGAIGADSIPNNAKQYERTLIRFAQANFGLNAPIPVFAAQIHQESTWRETAHSKYASGLSQFTPQTQEHVKKKYPELAYGNTLNPTWAIQAMTIYNRELYNAVTAIDECNRYAFMLAMYNGGSGWIWREKDLAEADGADRNAYWGVVENYRARAEWAKHENQGYPKRILLELQERYSNDGNWGVSKICSVTDGAKEPEEIIEVVEQEVIEEVPVKVPAQKKGFWARLFESLFK